MSGDSLASRGDNLCALFQHSADVVSSSTRVTKNDSVKLFQDDSVYNFSIRVLKLGTRLSILLIRDAIIVSLTWTLERGERASSQPERT